MAYLFMLLSIAAGSIKGYCGKRTSIYATRDTDASLFSFVRIFFCLIIGLIIVFVEGAHNSLAIDGKMLAICAFSGVTNAAFLIGWMLAVQKNSLVFVDVSLTLGSIIPAVLCLIFFGTEISLFKMIGFALIVVAAFILSFGQKSSKKTTLSGIMLVLVAMLGSGLNGFSQSLFNQYYGADAAGGVHYPNSVFLFYGYIFAALTLLVYFASVLLVKRRGASEKEPLRNIFSSIKSPLPFIAVMAICLFADNYTKQLALAEGMPSQVLYPVIQGACLITVNFTAAIFFGEKPTAKTFIGSAAALGGIVIMSLV